MLRAEDYTKFYIPSPFYQNINNLVVSPSLTGSVFFDTGAKKRTFMKMARNA
jgi:hypothetical protein